MKRLKPSGPHRRLLGRARQPARARGDPRRRRAPRGARRDLSGRPRRLRTVPQRGRPARARARHPHGDGQLRPGHRLRDRRLRLRLQDRRAARRGRRLAGLDRRRGERRDARLPAHARGSASCSRRRPASCSPCTAARGASTSTCSRTGRSRRWRGWPRRTRTGPSSSATRTSPTCARWQAPPSSTSAAAGRPRDGDWRVCYALVDPAARRTAELAVEFVRVRVRLRAADGSPWRHLADHRVHGAGRSLSPPATAQDPAGGPRRSA